MGLRQISSKKLTNGQIEMLHLLDRHLSEEDLSEVNELLTRHFYLKAQKEADQFLFKNKKSLREIDLFVTKLNKARTTTKRLAIDKVNESSH